MLKYEHIPVQDMDTVSSKRRRCEHCGCKLRLKNPKSVCALCYEKWRKKWFVVESRRAVNHVGRPTHA